MCRAAVCRRHGRPVPRSAKAFPGYLFALSTLALAAALYLLYASVVILKAYCPMCLLTDAAIIGIFIVSGAATSVPMTTLPRRFTRDLRALAGNPLAIAVTVLFIAGAASTLAFFPREGTSESGAAPAAATADQRSTELEQFMAQATRIPLVIPRDGAKVLVVKFNDFQCPACAQSHAAYKPILAKNESQNPGAVRVVLKDYPLNADCNPNSSMVHPAACHAAVAARLAREHNRGEQMEDWLYTNQHGMTVDSVKKAALDIGQVTDFDAKYAATLELVKADVALGTQLDIRSTPTFFINGVKVEGTWATQYFDQAIAYRAAEPACPIARERSSSRNLRPHQRLQRRLLAQASVSGARLSDAGGPGGRGLRISGTERRRQDDDAEAAHAAGLSHLGPCRDSGPAARRAGDQAAHRLPRGNPYFYDYLTAEELLMYFGALFGYDAVERRKRTARLLDLVGIAGERRMQLRKFSKGMLQRVGIAQALLNEPDLVILDEPMSGLDPLGRRDVRALILSLRDRGCTVFFSSHVLSDAEALCSRVAILARGRLVASGGLNDMLAFEARGWELVVAGIPRGAIAHAWRRYSSSRSDR